MVRVLVVEDDEVIAQGVAAHLRLGGFDPLVVGKTRRGSPAPLRAHPDVCVQFIHTRHGVGYKLEAQARA